MDIGEKLRRLRSQRGLTQEELANRCELSKGFISQVERDLTSPSIATLVDLLQCLGTDLRAFFGEREQEKIVFHTHDMFEKIEDESLHGRIQWLVPNAQKNGMEPILVEIGPGGESILDDPHEGEEFGFVLSGSITVVLGDSSHKAKKEESFYFLPTVPHQLKNAGKGVARVLWVCTPPSF